MVNGSSPCPLSFTDLYDEQYDEEEQGYDEDDYDDHYPAQPVPKVPAGKRAQAKPAVPKPPGTQQLLATRGHSTQETAAKAKTTASPSAQKLVQVAEGRLKSLSFVVVGHVDAGKSTLCGQLLLKVGAVSTQLLRKYQKESEQIGKSSFAYAWFLDEGEDERTRGVTIDVCAKHFKTKNWDVTILDAPGHRDFVPNILTGAVQADVALVVVDSSNFDAGFERDGQTKEHTQLVSCLGIEQIIVVVNKLDVSNWDESVFETIKSKYLSFANSIGINSQSCQFIPASAFQGVNLTDCECRELRKWYNGPTIIEALDRIKLPSRPVPDCSAFVACVSDVNSWGGSVAVSARVVFGAVTVGMSVTVQPSNDVAKIKGHMTVCGTSAKTAIAGDYIDSISIVIDPARIQIGSVLVSSPVPISETFAVRISVFPSIDLPLLPGRQMILYMHTAVVEASIVRFLSGEKKIKVLSQGQTGVALVQAANAVPFIEWSGSGPIAVLSRVVMRSAGRSIAAGVIVPKPAEPKKKSWTNY